MGDSAKSSEFGELENSNALRGLGPCARGCSGGQTHSGAAWRGEGSGEVSEPLSEPKGGYKKQQE